LADVAATVIDCLEVQIGAPFDARVSIVLRTPHAQ
jgi:hypothetical protein